MPRAKSGSPKAAAPAKAPAAAAAPAGGGSVSDMIAAVNKVADTRSSGNGATPGAAANRGAPQRRPTQKLSEQLQAEQDHKLERMDAAENAERPPEVPSYENLDKRFIEGAGIKADGSGELEPTAEDVRAAGRQQQTQQDDDGAGEEWPEYLLSSALESGLDYRDYSTPEALGRAIIRNHDQRERREVQDQIANPGAKKPAPEAPAAFDPFDGKRDEYDELSQAAIDRVNGRLEDTLKKLEAAEKRSQNFEAYVREQHDQQIDSYFSALDEKYGGVFGTQPLNQLHKASPEYKARARVAKFVENLLDEQGGRPTQQMFDQVAAVLWGDKPEKVARTLAADNTKRVIDRRRGSMVGAPSQREEAPLKPRDEGIEQVRRFIHKSNGQSAGV